MNLANAINKEDTANTPKYRNLFADFSNQGSDYTTIRDIASLTAIEERARWAADASDSITTANFRARSYREPWTEDMASIREELQRTARDVRILREENYSLRNEIRALEYRLERR